MKIKETLKGIKINESQFYIWLAALRSGKYPQTTGKLQDEKGYCCLGVACELFIADADRVKDVYGRLDHGLPISQDAAPSWVKHINMDFDLRNRCEGVAIDLTVLNDSMKQTFDEIADSLEAIYVHGVMEGV